ncbi:hypothetical protein N431DRAFT_516991 [Stipitochalara longipes BDJ]|nr:hypothetical protein N431DRAFT_516991 [Stipitochalara longipes BDJ]
MASSHPTKDHLTMTNHQSLLSPEEIADFSEIFETKRMILVAKLQRFDPQQRFQKLRGIGTTYSNEMATDTLEGLSKIDEAVERQLSQQEINRLHAAFLHRMKEHENINTDLAWLLKATLETYFLKHIVDTIQAFDVDRQIEYLQSGNFPLWNSFIERQRFCKELILNLSKRSGDENPREEIKKEASEWQNYISQLDDVCVHRVNDIKQAISNVALNPGRAEVLEAITTLEGRADVYSKKIGASYWRHESVVEFYEKYSGKGSSKALDEHRKMAAEYCDPWQKLGDISDNLGMDYRHRLQELWNVL